MGDLHVLLAYVLPPVVSTNTGKGKKHHTVRSAHGRPAHNSPPQHAGRHAGGSACRARTAGVIGADLASAKPCTGPGPAALPVPAEAPLAAGAPAASPACWSAAAACDCPRSGARSGSSAAAGAGAGALATSCAAGAGSGDSGSSDENRSSGSGALHAHPACNQQVVAQMHCFGLWQHQHAAAWQARHIWLPHEQCPPCTCMPDAGPRTCPCQSPGRPATLQEPRRALPRAARCRLRWGAGERSWPVQRRCCARSQPPAAP